MYVPSVNPGTYTVTFTSPDGVAPVVTITSDGGSGAGADFSTPASATSLTVNCVDAVGCSGGVKYTVNGGTQVNCSGSGTPGTSVWTCNNVAGTVTCTRTNLGIAAAPTLTIVVTSPMTGDFTNTGTLIATNSGILRFNGTNTTGNLGTVLRTGLRGRFPALRLTDIAPLKEPAGAGEESRR